MFIIYSDFKKTCLIHIQFLINSHCCVIRSGLQTQEELPAWATKATFFLLKLNMKIQHFIIGCLQGGILKGSEFWTQSSYLFLCNFICKILNFESMVLVEISGNFWICVWFTFKTVTWCRSYSNRHRQFLLGMYSLLAYITWRSLRFTDTLKLRYNSWVLILMMW